MPIKAVIYDHDGTLVNSLPMVVAATNDVLLARGLPERPPSEIVAAMVMPTTPRMGHHARVDDPRIQEVLAREFYLSAHRVGPTHASLYPGVAALVAEVSARGLPQAMVSNNEGRLVRRLMAALGIDGHFACILGEEDVPAPKPDPRGILHAASRLGVHPDSCIYVGDGHGDVAAAHGAGMRVIGVTWGIHPRAEMESMGFDHLAHDTTEVLQLISGNV